MRIGRIRKGLSGSAVAAAAMAALTASQAPEVLGSENPSPPEPQDRSSAQEEPADVAGPEAPPQLPYHTDLPPLDTAGPGQGGGGGDGADLGPAEAGIPATVLDAYRQAEATLADTTPACNLDWRVLAAIGKVESGHARGGDVDADGTTSQPILGPVLNGDGFAQIHDTDDGRWDSDALYDRAVGPMQFIPSTWANWGADGNGDGRSDPNNVYDATLAAGDYLCAADRDLAVSSDLDRALLSYNHSWDYVRTVRSWLDFYRDEVHEVPDGEGSLPDSPGPGNPDPTPDGEGGTPGGNGGTPDGDGGTPSPPPPAEEEGEIRPIPEDPEDPPEDPQDPDDPWEPGEPPECPEDPEDPENPEDPEDPENPGEEEPGEEETEVPAEPAPSPSPAAPTDLLDLLDPADPTDPTDPGEDDGEEDGEEDEDGDGCPDPEDPEEPEDPEDPEEPGDPGEPESTPTATPSATLTRRAG
nr:lytic transglycosylase domain-containing protein [Streptomyces sp. SBT349]